MAQPAGMDPCCHRTCDVFPGQLRALVPQFPPSTTWRWDRRKHAANKPVREWGAVGWRSGMAVCHFGLISVRGSMAVGVVYKWRPGVKTTGIVIRRLAPPQQRPVFGLRSCGGRRTANIIIRPLVCLKNE